jgi:hypothetical protein
VSARQEEKGHVLPHTHAHTLHGVIQRRVPWGRQAGRQAGRQVGRQVGGQVGGWAGGQLGGSMEGACRAW